jgi:hypothetical protein
VTDNRRLKRAAIFQTHSMLQLLDPAQVPAPQLRHRPQPTAILRRQRLTVANS